MTDTSTVPPPDSLSETGAALWVYLHGEYEFDEQDRALVLEIARTVDALEALDAVLREEGFTASGSAGQRVIHPAVAEARQQRLVLARLLAALNLPAEDGGVSILRASSVRAQAANQARWKSHNRAKAAL